MSESFFFYPKRQVAAALLKRGFVVVRGRKPIPSSIRVVELDEKRAQLVVETQNDQARALYVPCSDSREGFFYASTESLPPDGRSRSLYLELCRGQLSRIQRKRADWVNSGFSTPERLRGQIRRAIQKFSALVTTDPDAPEYDAATFALFTALCEIARRLNEQYLSQTLAARRRTSSWVSRFGFAVGDSEDWLASYDALFGTSKTNRKRPKLEPLFQTINVRVNWRDVARRGDYDWSRVAATVDAARERGLRVTLGPLTRWGTDMPRELQSTAIDADMLQDEYMKFLRSAVAALGNRVQRWIVAANVEAALDLKTLEFRLASAAIAADYLRDKAPQTETFLGFEQAFGDSTRFRALPLVYAVDLATKLAERRAFDGFYVEANFGLVPNTTAPRDPMELHRFFDRWRSLGVRLAVATSCPSAAPFLSPETLDPSDRFVSVFAEKPRHSFFFRQSKEEKPLEERLWSVQVQQELARRFYSSALAYKTIDELIWTRWRDSAPMNYYDYSDLVAVYDRRLIQEELETPQESAPKQTAATNDETEADADQYADEFFDDAYPEDEIFDEIELAPSDSSAHSWSESVSYSAEVEAPEDFTPTSGLLDKQGVPKPTLYKLAALRRAYLDN